MSSRKLRARSASTSQSSTSPRVKRRKTQSQEGSFQRSTKDKALPEVQSALLLHAIRQPYGVSTEHELPEVLHEHELLIKVNAAGLNPIDWKAP